MPPTQNNDATFVRILLEILYKGNIGSLLLRSVSGRSRQKSKSNETPFKAISLEKKQAIYHHFLKRNQNANVTLQESFDRLKTTNIDRHIRNGITNIRRHNNECCSHVALAVNSSQI